MDVLNAQDEEDAAMLLAQEEERQREEALRKRVGVLSYDGHMEKKSPAHNLWQVQYIVCVPFKFAMTPSRTFLLKLD